MDYEGLTGALESLGERNLRIDHALVFKVGCTCLEQKEDSAARLDEQQSASQGEIKAPDPYVQMINSLEKHPNIFDLKVIGEEGLGLRFAQDSRIFVMGKTFCMRVDVPQRLQKYRDELSRRESAIEEFNVVSTGSLFAAFARIRDYPVFTYIGHEYREIVAAQIDKETSFDHIPFGPCPIHPDFYVVVRKRDSITAGTKVYSIDDDVFVVVDQHSDSDVERCKQLFWDIESEVLDFYSIKMDESVLLERDDELFRDFSEEVAPVLVDRGGSLGVAH